MTKRNKPLTKLFCDSVAEPGRYTDKNGLMLAVSSSGAKRWMQRIVILGHRRDLGLGSYPLISLKEAREKAEQNRKMARSGGDPLAEKRRENEIPTFEVAAERYLDEVLPKNRNKKHIKQWGSTLRTYAYPVLGKMKVNTIQTSDVERVLRPIWETKTETARRLRARIEKVMGYCQVKEWREGQNPALWQSNLEILLPKPSDVRVSHHHPRLDVKDAPNWLSHVKRRQGVSARALEFLTLTWARSGEVRLARWDEFDFENSNWTIPAHRMKSKRQHVVPLSSEAVSLLKNLPIVSDNPLVFPARKGGPLTDMALSEVMRKIYKTTSNDNVDPLNPVDPQSGRPAVPHGLRSTARTWAQEAGYDWVLAELALSHNVGTDVSRAYMRTDMLEARREMLEQWARFLEKHEYLSGVRTLPRIGRAHKNVG